MATSLAAQLQRLAIPQATVYKEHKKVASLLFDPKEAALKDRDTFFEIGRSGLSDLILLYEGFQVYEDTLFSVSSKDFERSVQTKEVNKNLDEAIEKFLLQLSPFLLLESSHKALEWLVNRYHIHEYNQNSILALILPYHSTKIFVRFIQLMRIKTDVQWKFLVPIQKHGVALSSQVLYNQCAANNWLLQFIAKTTAKYAKHFGERATQLNTVFAFFCQTAIGTIDSIKKVTEPVITCLLPTLVTAIASPIADFRASAYIILGYLFTKSTIKAETLDHILEKLLTTELNLSYDTVLLITILYEHQSHYDKMSETVLNDISCDIMMDICQHLKVLVRKKNNIFPFVKTFVSRIMPLIQNNGEEFMRFSKLPLILLDEVDLKNQQPEKIIKCVLDAYNVVKITTKKRTSESDIEIIEEEGEEEKFHLKVFHWYAQLLKIFERQYPDAFDKIIKAELSSTNKIKVTKKKALSKLLEFKPSVAHKVAGSYLFENLNHVNPPIRVQAIKYMGEQFDAIFKQDPEFLKEAYLNRLADEHPNVVEAALALPIEQLNVILNEIEMTDALVKICSNYDESWDTVVSLAIDKFCQSKKMPINQEVLLALLPHLFPDSEESANVAWIIHKSKLGATLKLGKIDSSYKDNPTMIRKSVFKTLFETRAANLDDILDENILNKSNTTHICLFLLLKSSSFERMSVEEISKLLNLLLESVETRSIVMSAESKPFSSEIMIEFFKEAKEDHILFEVMEYLFTRVIEAMNVKQIPKPWCNVCKGPEMILIRRLYEICIIGCTIPCYADNYVKLLQKLLNKFLISAQEKFEFIANFASGHIFCAADPKDVIGPELQLRSLKLLMNFLAVQKKYDWMFNSNVVILMIIFSLNNPVKAIRECTLDIATKLLENKPKKDNVYATLLENILEHTPEILLDHDQIIEVLNTILTSKANTTKAFRQTCTSKLTSILKDAPPHIKASFLQIFDRFTSPSVISQLFPSLKSLEKVIVENTLDTKITFDGYESSIFKSIYSHINENITVDILEEQNVWSSIEIGLKEYRECILDKGQSFTSPSVLIMKQIENEIYQKLSQKHRRELVRLISLAGAVSNNPAISSVAAKTIKKIHLSFDDFKPILENMLKVQDADAQNKKKKSTSISMLSYRLTETEEWKLGVAILEYVQNKKKMDSDNSFVSLLFELLNKCLRFEEQSYVEYTKQLILSSLWYYCKKFLNETDKSILNSVKSVFKVELIVQCIRGTQNPQTHHHALILLSNAAYLLPEQVLHHTMEIFTFMGSSLLRHDDAYSFQIITRIIETLIPILVKLDKSVEEHTEKELQQLQKRVVPVLRIFADVVLHVPEHRRLPLYKKLMETIGANQFLWILIALLLDAHVMNFSDSTKKTKKSSRTLADQEAPINRLDFGQSVILEFLPDVGLENFIKLVLHIKSLPLQKDEDAMDTNVDSSDVFSVNGHTANQLRHYKYVCVTFMNSCLASSRFIHHCSLATNTKVMETHYKSLIINILTFIQSISKITDEKSAKYWRVMLHHSYDLLDHTNNLLSAAMFLNVIRGLLKHNLLTVRRKAMELLNSKIQHNPEFLADTDKDLLFSLLEPLLDNIKTIENKDENLTEITAQELELNQQTALLSLKLLTRLLAAENPEPFKSVLEIVTGYTCNPDISGNVMASVVLCLAELCSNLKAHALVSLRKFMPALIKVLKKQRKAETPELVLLSTVTAIAKIVESLPLFLSPYLQKILCEYSILYGKWQNTDQESVVVGKLSIIKKKIAAAIPPRVLIPVVNETHQVLLAKESYYAIGPVMSVLADSFANVTTADFTALQQDLTAFFLNALQLRSDAVEKDIDSAIIDSAEDEVVNALVSLVLKLSETSFRPFYFKIYDWAIRSNMAGPRDRAITFYRLSSAIAEKLKGLFVLFAGHFIKNAADLLDACNNSKTEEYYYDSEEKCLTLIKYIIKTLHIVFLYDSQSFLNKDRFETLMQPVVDQLENTMGGILSLKARAIEFIIPCVSQFAVATADDSLWKLLNYQILLKTRHNDAEIRLTALDCLVSMATQLGSSWLPLLAESVPFLAELLEDGDARIETATKDAIRKLEQILGEPLEKYF